MGADHQEDALQLIPDGKRRWCSPRALRIATGLFALAATALGCAGNRPGAARGAATGGLTGVWRAVLSSPGGELPFTIRIDGDGDPPTAIAVNGEEEVRFSSVSLDGSRLRLRIDGYDSQIVATVSRVGTGLTGTWSKTVPAGRSRLPFRATQGDSFRFGPEPPPAARDADRQSVPSVHGTWMVKFTDDDGTQPARAEFRQIGDRVTGTFLTPTGDYRFLDGDYRAGFLRLSTFDGGHAFLFHATATADGTLQGDFWSRDTYHAVWSARRPTGCDDADSLPDPFSVVRLTNDAGRLRFTFPDLDGRPVSLTDPRFTGKVVLVSLFGSWCPNCNDEAPLLASWHRRYAERGLEIVGLAYEFTGDTERDVRFVRRYARRHEIDFPLLLAGTSDKSAAGETLPDLSSVEAYPTNIFVGRDGTVRRIHSGFAGPATGEHHRKLVAEFETLLEALLAEPAPGG